MGNSYICFFSAIIKHEVFFFVSMGFLANMSALYVRNY